MGFSSNEDDAADSSSSTFGTRGHDSDDEFEDEIKGIGSGDDDDDDDGRIVTSADMASWSGQPHVKGSSETMRMVLLTFSLIGLQ